MKIRNKLLLKFLILFTLLGLGNLISNGQTTVDLLLEEDYNVSQTPAGWNQSNIDWNYSENSKVRIKSEEETVKSYLTTPTIYANNYDYIKITIEEEYVTYSSNDKIYFDISIDGGITYNPAHRIYISTGIQSYNGINIYTLTNPLFLSNDFIIRFGADLQAATPDKTTYKQDKVTVNGYKFLGGTYKAVAVTNDGGKPSLPFILDCFSPTNINDINIEIENTNLPTIDITDIEITIGSFVIDNQSYSFNQTSAFQNSSTIKLPINDIVTIQASFTLDPNVMPTDLIGNPTSFNISIFYIEYDANNNVVDIGTIPSYAEVIVGNCCSSDQIIYDNSGATFDIPLWTSTTTSIIVGTGNTTSIIETIESEIVVLQADDYIEFIEGYIIDVNELGYFEAIIDNCDDNAYKMESNQDYFNFNEAKGINITPNPCNDFFYINRKELEKTTDIWAINMNGTKTLLPFQIFDSNNLKVDAQLLSQGLYLLQIISPNNIDSSKIIKN